MELSSLREDVGLLIANIQMTDPAGNPLRIISTNTSVSGFPYSFSSTAMLSSLERNQFGLYSCTGTVSSSRQFLSTSDSVTGTINIGQYYNIL